MATRATYKINNTTFYCHWDGYPAGAAGRFAKMLAALTVASTPENRPVDALEDRRGGLEFAFIRGNLDAEPTKGHDHHGDTDFQYTLTGGNSLDEITITVRERLRDSDYKYRTIALNADLVEWINAQRAPFARRLAEMKAKNPGTYKDVDPEADALETVPICVKVKETCYGGTRERFTYATLTNAKAVHARHLQMAKHFTGKEAEPENPNKKIHQMQAAAWRFAIEESGVQG